MKPANIMFTDNTYEKIKIIDFGFATYFKTGAYEYKMMGTVNFKNFKKKLFNYLIIYNF